jgi:hypothetical protein
MANVVAERIARAQAELAEGRVGQAEGTLGDVVKATDDPALLEQMRDLANQGLERSGRFGRGGWRSMLKAIDKQLARLDGTATTG